MIISHSDCLHKGITDSSTNKFKSPSLEIFVQGIQLAGTNSYFLMSFPTIYNGFPTCKLPYIFFKCTKLFLNFQKILSICDSCNNNSVETFQSYMEFSLFSGLLSSYARLEMHQELKTRIAFCRCEQELSIPHHDI